VVERERVQQPCAEGVDGLHLQAARRFERGGKQPARPGSLAGIGPAAGRKRDRSVERGVVERGPARKPLEHFVRHIGGGGLGEGDAENFGGVDAAQQQIDHPLSENIGLAGAGIGRHESGDVRIGGLDLHAAHVGWNGAWRGHGKDLAAKWACSLSP
jgi:hypothetical protein